MPSGQWTPRKTRQRYAVMVLAARSVARRQAIGLDPLRSDLEKLPQAVQLVLEDLKPEWSRYLPSRFDSGRKRSKAVATVHMPKHIWGFGKKVMAAIAADAGCRPTTLYSWVKEFDRRALHRATKWRPKGERARRMRAEG